MNPRYPYSPDMNAPRGMPRGYPYGAPPMPTSNPMHPSYPSAPGYPTSSYPSATQPYPSTTSPYPSTTSPYPSATSPYPSTTSSYSPAGQHYPGASPYPSAGSPYPADNSQYPSAADNSPYPSATGNSPYPSAAGSSPYPSATGGSPYPSATGSSPYPSATGNSQYPSSYPSSISPSHPSNPSPYSTGGMYPSSTSYPSTTPLYPNAGGYPPANSGQNYNVTGSSAVHQPSTQGRYLPNMAHLMVTEGTVRAYHNFDPKQDAEVLRKAMKGFGTDEKAIINVLAKRSNEQRVYIGVAFKQLYGKDLIDDLKSELTGNLEDAIIGLMTPTFDYLASEIHQAMSGVGTDEDVLIEILCTRGNQEIWAINEAYRRLYGKNLEEDIKSDTSGHFQRLLVSACTGARSEDPPNEELAKQNAHALHAAGVGQWGTDESVFNSILVSQSFHQLAVTFYEYQKLAGHTVAEAIDKEMSGDLKKGMLAIARTVENRPFYFAEKLYKAMKGLGTDDRTLIRIIVTRCEVDMVQIKAEYERNYGKPLSDAIHGDTSGDYRRLLIALVDGC